MTNRAGWVGFDPNDNQHLWNLWDDFGIEHAHMYGYWNESTAVKLKVHDVNTTPPNNDPPPGGDGPVLATAYVRPGNVTLVAIASWSTSAMRPGGRCGPRVHPRHLKTQRRAASAAPPPPVTGDIAMAPDRSAPCRGRRAATSTLHRPCKFLVLG